jgi:hypothetical protein
VCLALPNRLAGQLLMFDQRAPVYTMARNDPRSEAVIENCVPNAATALAARSCRIQQTTAHGSNQSAAPSPNLSSERHSPSMTWCSAGWCRSSRTARQISISLSAHFCFQKCR